MPRYINTDSAVNVAKRVSPLSVVDFEKILDLVPTADVEEVVRCEKCILWEKYENTAGAGYCKCDNFSFSYGNGRIFNPITMPNFHCGYGKTKKEV